MYSRIVNKHLATVKTGVKTVVREVNFKASMSDSNEIHENPVKI